MIIDISAKELAKAPAGYRKRVLDVTQPLTGKEGTYDLVFSKMLAEHVSDSVMVVQPFIFSPRFVPLRSC